MFLRAHPLLGRMRSDVITNISRRICIQAVTSLVPSHPQEYSLLTISEMGVFRNASFLS